MTTWTTLVPRISFALLIGCSAAGPGDEGGPDAGGGGKADDPDGCKLTCGPDDCGITSDGCDGVIDCGPCGSGGGGGGECTPLTCEEGMCGVHDNGCEGTIDCQGCSGSLGCVDGMCTCENDSLEDNDTMQAAYDLGTYEGRSNYSASVDNMILAGDDEDWFRLGVLDTPNWGNPKTTFTLNASGASQSIRLAVGYECTADEDADLNCGDGSVYEPTVDACVVTASPGSTGAKLSIKPNCTGGATDEDGVAIISVTSACSGANCAGLCDSYNLAFALTE